MEGNNDISMFNIENKEYKVQHGPRAKSKATMEFENLIKKIANPENWDNTTFKFNSKNELVCYIDKGQKIEFYNVTQIFFNKPDLEQLSFDENSIKNIQNYFQNQSRMSKHKFQDIIFPQMSAPEKSGVRNYTEYFYTLINDGFRKKGIGPIITLDEVELRASRKENVGELRRALERYEFKEFEFILSNEANINDTVLPFYDEYKTKLIILSKEGNIALVINGVVQDTGRQIPTDSKEWSILIKEFDPNGKLSKKGVELIDGILCRNQNLIESIDYVSIKKRKIGALTFLSRDWLINAAVTSYGLSKHYNQTKLYLAKNEQSINLSEIGSNALIIVGPTINENEYKVYRFNKEDIRNLKEGGNENFEIDNLLYGLIDITHNNVSDEMIKLIKENENKSFSELNRTGKNYTIIDDLIISVNNQIIAYEDCDLIQCNETFIFDTENIKGLYPLIKSNYAYIIKDNIFLFIDKINGTESKIHLDEINMAELQHKLDKKFNQNDGGKFNIRQLTAREIDDIIQVQFKNKLKIERPPKINRDKLKFHTFDKTEILYRCERQNEYLRNVFLPDLKKNLDDKGYKIHFYDAFLSTSLKKLSGFGSGNNKAVITIFEHQVGHGKNIAVLSQAKHEEERLFAPGTQVLIYKMEDKPDAIYIHAKMIRSLDNVFDPNSYSAECVFFREKYIELQDNLIKLFRDMMNKQIKIMTGNKGSDINEIFKSVKIIKLEKKYDKYYKQIYNKCQIMIDLLALDDSLPEKRKKIEDLNLAIYHDFLMLNEKELFHRYAVVDLLPTPLRIVETFKNSLSESSHKKPLNDLVIDLNNTMEKDFGNDPETTLYQSVFIFVHYFRLLKKSSSQPGIFGVGSTLAEEIRKIVKNIFDINLPAKLDSNGQLNIVLSQKFKKMVAKFALDDLIMLDDEININIGKKDTFETILDKIKNVIKWSGPDFLPPY